MDLAPDLWPISIDRKALETVLLNLLENAADATAQGGQLRIETRNILHTLADNAALSVELPPGRYVELIVTDTGTGIPEDRLPHIFDPFYTSKPVGAGTGLGLSIVDELVRAYGGRLTLAASDMGGLKVILELPAAEA